MENFNNISFEEIINNENLVNNYITEKRKNFNYGEFIFDTLPNYTTYNVDVTKDLFKNVDYKDIKKVFRNLLNQCPYQNEVDNYSYYLNYPLKSIFFEEQCNKNIYEKVIFDNENTLEDVIKYIGCPNDIYSHNDKDYLKINSSLDSSKKENLKKELANNTWDSSKYTINVDDTLQLNPENVEEFIKFCYKIRGKRRTNIKRCILNVILNTENEEILEILASNIKFINAFKRILYRKKESNELKKDVLKVFNYLPLTYYTIKKEKLLNTIYYILKKKKVKVNSDIKNLSKELIDKWERLNIENNNDDNNNIKNINKNKNKNKNDNGYENNININSDNDNINEDNDDDINDDIDIDDETNNNNYNNNYINNNDVDEEEEEEEEEEEYNNNDKNKNKKTVNLLSKSDIPYTHDSNIINIYDEKVLNSSSLMNNQKIEQGEKKISIKPTLSINADKKLVSQTNFISKSNDDNNNVELSNSNINMIMSLTSENIYNKINNDCSCGSFKRISNFLDSDNPTKRLKISSDGIKNTSVHIRYYPESNHKPIISILKRSNSFKPKKHVSFKPDGMIKQYRLIYDDGRDLYLKNQNNKIESSLKNTSLSSNYYFLKMMQIPIIYPKGKRSEEKKEDEEINKKRIVTEYSLNKEMNFSPLEIVNNTKGNSYRYNPSLNHRTLKLQQWSKEIFIQLIEKSIKEIINNDYNNKNKEKHPNLNELKEMLKILNDNKNYEQNNKSNKKLLRLNKLLNNIYVRKIPKTNDPIEYLYLKLKRKHMIKSN